MTSSNGRNLIKQFEGCILHPYQDQVGYWTIGWGARYDLNGKEVTKNTPTLTQDQAESLLIRDLKRFEDRVNKYITIALSQNQFDACVSFDYNTGRINELAPLINAGTIKRSNWTAYCRARDQKTKQLVTLPGLVARRNKEADLFGI